MHLCIPLQRSGVKGVLWIGTMERSFSQRKGLEILQHHVRNAIFLALAQIIQGHLELLGKALDGHSIRALFREKHLDIDDLVVIVQVECIVRLIRHIL